MIMVILKLLERKQRREEKHFSVTKFMIFFIVYSSHPSLREDKAELEKKQRRITRAIKGTHGIRSVRNVSLGKDLEKNMVEICVIMRGNGESELGTTGHCSAFDKN